MIALDAKIGLKFIALEMINSKKETISETPKGFSSLKERKTAGAHYTPSILARFVAKEILAAWKKPSNKITILDPAVGNGDLLVHIIDELPRQKRLNAEIYGFETDINAIKSAEQRIKDNYPEIPTKLRFGNFLEFAVAYDDQSLFRPSDFDGVDLVIANPPYVRTQVMGALESQRLATQFGLSGRVDLYFAFLEGIARVLKPGGLAGVIVSNRFMTTRSGAAVRESISDKFDIIHVWDLGDTQLFEAAVLPAVLLLKRKYNSKDVPCKTKFTSIYSAPAESRFRAKADNPIEALNYKGLVRISTGQQFKVQHGILDAGKDSSDVWRISNRTTDAWMNVVNMNTFCTFGDIGKIRVGLKTTADKVFIRDDWDILPQDEQPEVLKPLITHFIARRYKAIETNRPAKVLYTHGSIDGKRCVIDILEYPKTAKYLSRFRSTLEGRTYVREAGRKWYEIWVPQDPDAWKYPKIVFRDIVDKPTFWMDLTGAIVNGDCYWLSSLKEDDELLWLALAVGNSSFIEEFYDRRFHNKLYSGRRRFITQYVEKFPIPNPKTKVATKIVSLTKKLFKAIESEQSSKLEKRINKLVWESFGLAIKESIR